MLDKILNSYSKLNKGEHNNMLNPHKYLNASLIKKKKKKKNDFFFFLF
jgi:hypothetical protein